MPNNIKINWLTQTKARLSVILPVLVIFQILCASATNAARTVKVGIYNNKPLVFMDESGKPKGIFVDLLEHVAAKEQWDLKYVPGTWSDCLDRLESGEIDLMTAIAYSAERARKYNYAYTTVLTNWGQVFVAKNSKITSVLELESKKIAVKMDDIHFHGIKDLTSRFNIECRFLETDEYDTVFEMIEAGRVQAGVVNRLFGIQNKSDYLVKETPIMFNPIELRFAAPRQRSMDLLSVIDIHLQRMQAQKDSFYSQTLNNWLVAPSDWMVPDSVKYILVGVGIILLLFAAMNITLRIKVKNRTQALSSANEKLQGEVQIREKIEEELRKYERIVASSTDHMAMIDLAYAYQAVNDAALKAIGKDRGEVIGKKTWEILNGNLPRETHQQRLERAFSGQTVKYRTWIDFPDLGRRYMDIVYTPYVQSDDRIAGCVVNARDITERYELEKKLENAQKMEFMGTIAGGVAHDLNNILSGIVSYPELLLLQLPEDSPLKKPIETIKRSGEKAAVIVQDLLTLARRGAATHQPVDLNKIITQFLNSPECHRIQSFHPTIRIKTVLAERLRSISGSSVHLSKTVMNLLYNAAEAMPDGGEIRLSTQHRDLKEAIVGDTNISAGEYVMLEIADNGIGISREDLKKIFEPFYTKKIMGRSGTGLGLAVVWGTVMDHHGHIEVESDGHRGTVFRLYLPVSQDDAQSAAGVMKARDYMGNGESILIVDDLEEQREIASSILSALGYSVATVPSGEDAIAYLKKDTVDVVILDMLMPPGIDGLTTYEEILKNNPGQKAIIASGFAETVRVKNALNLGVGQFIKKPYTIGDVGFAVKKALAG